MISSGASLGTPASSLVVLILVPVSFVIREELESLKSQEGSSAKDPGDGRRSDDRLVVS